MLRRVAPVRTYVLEDRIASIIRVTKIGERHNIPQDGILHIHRSESLKSYIALTGWTL
jgi:hypothetical protein